MGPEPAPLSRRTPAFLLDQLVVILLVVPPAVAVGVPFEDVVLPGDTRQAIFLVLMGVAFVYHFLLEWLTGLTVGKRLLGLRVVADDGTPLGVRGSLLRNALRLIDGLLYWGVAVAIILLRGDGKRLGDVVGRTLVVRDG
ncbi:RDD family protein [Halobacteriales archaeon SW_7_65_23]|nr:MAG: RDD family protein [Halobacteriales archaeon SW_7_65_23]